MSRSRGAKTHYVRWTEAKTGNVGTSDPMDLAGADRYAKMQEAQGNQAEVLPTPEKRGSR